MQPSQFLALCMRSSIPPIAWAATLPAAAAAAAMARLKAQGVDFIRLERDGEVGLIADGPFDGCLEIGGEELFAAVAQHQVAWQSGKAQRCARREAKIAARARKNDRRRAIEGRDAPKRFTASGQVPRIVAASGGTKLPSFSGIAYTGAPMRPDGWFHQVIIDLEGVKVPNQHRPVLRQHDHEQLLGHTTAVRVTRAGVDVAGVFSGQDEHVDKVTTPAQNGFEWQLSVGANPIRTEFLAAGDDTVVNGRTISGPMTISRETELGEISFVPLGADQDTSVAVAASAAAASSASPARLSGGMQGETERIAAILRLCTSMPVIDLHRGGGEVTRIPLGSAAIECGWSVADVEEILIHAGGQRLPEGLYLGTFADVA